MENRGGDQGGSLSGKDGRPHFGMDGADGHEVILMDSRIPPRLAPTLVSTHGQDFKVAS